MNDPIDIACPHCHAEPTELCTSPRGKPRREVHRSRVEALEEAKAVAEADARFDRKLLDFEDAAIVETACPKCGSNPGQPCRPPGSTHRFRIMRHLGLR